MRLYQISTLVALLAAALPAFAADDGAAPSVTIEVLHLPTNCPHKSKKGDTINVHYEGKLEDGSVFDSSYGRGQPLSFKVGSGKVIKG
jgi:hypothetical protein